MSRTVLDYNAAHKFVDEQFAVGNDVRWEGWDIVFFSQTPWGFSNPDGAFRRDRVDFRNKPLKECWGMELRITPSDTGTWTIPANKIKAVR